MGFIDDKKKLEILGKVAKKAKDYLKKEV